MAKSVDYKLQSRSETPTPRGKKNTMGNLLLNMVKS